MGERKAEMVCLTRCSYCGGTTHDSEDHVDCRAAFLEDLLAQVQASLKKGKGKDLPVGLRRKLSEKKFSRRQKKESQSFDSYIKKSRLGPVQY
jgi:hypothetical protein